MRIGSLCSGYGGLDMAVQEVLGGTVAWHVENDPNAAAILDHHWPTVPNHGDLTATDWAAAEPVEVLTAGYPCQPFSHAGKRKGSSDERHLWPYVAGAIGALRPRLVVLENVRGHVSLGLDAVVGDLSGLGYDARWGVVRAADAGAPHGRARIFIVAHPHDSAGHREWTCAQPREGGPAADTDLIGHERTGSTRGQQPGPEDGSLLPTPRATDGTKGGPNQRGSSGDLMLPSAVVLLPTPAVNDMGEGKTPDAWDAWTAAMQDKHGNGNGHGKSLSIEAQRLLPTPNAIDGNGGAKRLRADGRTEADHGPQLRDVAVADHWGIYADAITRWENLTRPAPAPTQVSRKGTPQLAPRFSEWLMGLPEGHVTGVQHLVPTRVPFVDEWGPLTRNAQLKALGNGVVPQQAALALRLLLPDLAMTA